LASGSQPEQTQLVLGHSELDMMATSCIRNYSSGSEEVSNEDLEAMVTVKRFDAQKLAPERSLSLTKSHKYKTEVFS